jgi:hypothetical protein
VLPPLLIWLHPPHITDSHYLLIIFLPLAASSCSLACWVVQLQLQQLRCSLLHLLPVAPRLPQLLQLSHRRLQHVELVIIVTIRLG